METNGLVVLISPKEAAIVREIEVGAAQVVAVVVEVAAAGDKLKHR